MEVKYSTSIPPVYKRCNEVFKVDWSQGIVITYGDTVHSKLGEDLTDDLKAHESTHSKQQTEMGKDIWWDRYFIDKDFRLSQEVEAYKNQMNYAKKYYQSKHYKWLLDRVTSDMEDLYGGMCTKEEALKLIS